MGSKISFRGRDYWEDYAPLTPKEEDQTHASQTAQATQKLCWRDYLLFILNSQTTTPLALAYFYTHSIMIFASVANYMVSTLPIYDAELDTNLGIFVVELITTAFFTFEYLMKFTLTREVRMIWVWHPQNIIDALATLPFYISTLTLQKNVRILFLARLFRIFRLLRLMYIANSAKEMKIYYEAFQYRGKEIIAGFVTITCVAIVIATAMFYAEQTGSRFDNAAGVWIYSNGVVSTFQSIPDTMYYATVCMSTLGYGDMYPRTVLGRFVTVIAITVGIFLYSFPSVILSISANRKMEIYSENRRNKARLELLKLTSRGKGMHN